VLGADRARQLVRLCQDFETVDNPAPLFALLDGTQIKGAL